MREHTYGSVLAEWQDDIEPTLDSSSNGTWANWSVFYTKVIRVRESDVVPEWLINSHFEVSSRDCKMFITRACLFQLRDSLDQVCRFNHAASHRTLECWRGVSLGSQRERRREGEAKTVRCLRRKRAVTLGYDCDRLLGRATSSYIET
ncbi:hypothetical protein K0M31_009597 [Melipona bicolor]|uniref:Uncharacterized protein n=1 Tax=Melipona bicolor TaxID=60889 RepID=A0AA40KJ70_9HYME|nr:hypothetical protein K0M31_009597 [Melipona bicolor]